VGARFELNMGCLGTVVTAVAIWMFETWTV
jgi:hypothetical protein